MGKTFLLLDAGKKSEHAIWTDNPEHWTGATRITGAEFKRRRKAEARMKLLRLLAPGDTVQTIMRHVSRSGMMRHISLVVRGEDVTYLVADLLDERRADDGGIKVPGCGMDMGFHLTYAMGCALYPDGYKCAGEACRASDHANPPHPKRKANGMLHKDGGYAFNQAWL